MHKKEDPTQLLIVGLTVSFGLKKGNVKECSKHCTTALISYASKVMFNILQVRLQQYVNQELPDVQAGFRKQPRHQCMLSHVIWT